MLDFSPTVNMFFFESKKPEMGRIYGIKRTRDASGKPIWCFPGSYPSGYLSLKDYTSLVENPKATNRALEQIEYLKEVPNKVQNTETLDSLGLEYKLSPFPHQLEVAEAMLHYHKLAVLLEQGMGKTYITHIFLEALRKLENRDVKCIVLAPRIVLRNWRRETAEHTDLKPFLYYGTTEQRLRQREEVQEMQPDILITNYETLVPPTQDFTKAGLVHWWLNLPAERREELCAFWHRKGCINSDELKIAQIQYWTTKGETKVKKKYEDWVYQTIKRIPRNLFVTPDLMRSQRAIDDLRFIKSMDWDVLVLDEGSKIKGPQAKRSHAALNLTTDISRRYILSGTLCLGNPLDVFMPMKVLDHNIFGTNYKQFERRFSVYNRANKHIIERFQRLDELKRKMDPYVIEMKRDDHLSLPSRIMTKRFYEISEKQRELYNDIVENPVITYEGSELDVSLPIVKINKLKQVLSGHLVLPPSRDSYGCCNECEHVVDCVMEDLFPWDPECEIVNDIAKPKGICAELPNPKIDYLIEDIQTTNDKVIVWYYYRYDKTAIEAAFRKHNIKYITADDVDCDTTFENDDSYKVFVGQVSQGIGITLNSAVLTIDYSYDMKLEPRLQSLDRNMRIGQTRKVVVIDYMHEMSVEETTVLLFEHKKSVKEFVQNKPECPGCEHIRDCLTEEIEPYTKRCIHFGKRKNAEMRKRIKLNTI